MAQKSLVTFVRKQLKVKGKTEHTGRGSYWCHVDVTWDELTKRLSEKFQEWEKEGLIEDSNIISDNFSIIFKQNHFDEFYRRLVISKGFFNRNSAYQIHFTCGHLL